MRHLRLVAIFVLGYAVAAAPATPTLAATVEGAPAAETSRQRVLAISVDGLTPRVIRRLGRDRAPNLHRLLRHGASTLNARTVVEKTETLPNHTSMVTGRRVRASRGGHGVTWNVHRPGTTVPGAAGHWVASVFNVAHRRGSTALFTTKRKLSIFKRSWPGAVDRFTHKERQDWKLMKAARADLVNQRRRVFTFVHFGRPDVVGHHSGWGSTAYRRSVRQVDRLVGALHRAVRNHRHLSRTRIILTADHGGSGTSHADPTRLLHYRIPFLVWGPGVTAGDLYEMNPEYRNPGRRRVWYSGRQPIRNGDLANLALDLLGLGPVPGSEFDYRQTLDWR